MITTLSVTGMSCGSCVKHVEQAARTVPGVQAVRVDLKAGRATITHADTAAPADLIAAIVAAGYDATLAA